MTRLPAIALSALLLVLVAAGCAGKSATPTNKQGTLVPLGPVGPEARAAEESFALHAGLAYGAFHRYVWRPYETGAFEARPTVRLVAVIDAASGAQFAVHELRAAHADAVASGALRPLVQRIDALRRRLAGLGALFKRGALSTADVVGAATEMAQLRSAALRLGGHVRTFSPVF
jgi:hypothetical protein